MQRRDWIYKGIVSPCLPIGVQYCIIVTNPSDGVIWVRYVCAVYSESNVC